MTDLNTMTKAELAVIIGGMTPSQIKKAAHADLVQRAGEAGGKPDLLLDNSSILTPTEDDVLAVLKSLTVPEQHLLVAFAYCENTVVNAAPKQATVPADLTTWVWLEDRKVGQMTLPQKKGVLSSLVKKGLVHVTPDSDGDMLGWSLLGFDVVQSLIGQELPAIEKKQKVAPATRKGNEDRILVQPTDDATKISPIRAGTKRHMMAVALARGTTLEHLAEITGWSRSVVSAAIYTDFKAAGLGIERKAGTLAGHTRAACTLRVHRFDFEEVLAGSTTSIYQQTVAKTDGISSAVIGMRAAAGSAGALLELVALSDPSGGAVSAARIAADNILLDGSVTARHVEAGSMNADIIGAGFMNARFLEVTERLKISSGTGALSVGKDTAYDLASDGIYFGRTGSGGFGFLAGKKIGGVDQYIQATDETGLLTVNAAHYVTGTAASELSVTTSQTVTLPVGTKLLSLNIVGGGKGGRGSSGTATASGGDTTVALWDGATNTGISWTGVGASATTPADGPGGSSDYGVGGAGSTPVGGIARPGNPGTGYGAGGSGVSKGNGSGGTRDGGAGAITTRVTNYNISALANPKIVVTIGAGSAGSAPAGYNGGDGTNGIVKYSARENDLIMASVIPLAPTYTGTITKAASGKLTFPNYGAGMWCLSAQGTNLLLDYVTTHASGKTVKLTNGNYACFISDITPVDDAVSATAVTYEYQFFKLGNWV